MIHIRILHYANNHAEVDHTVYGEFNSKYIPRVGETVELPFECSTQRYVVKDIVWKLCPLVGNNSCEAEVDLYVIAYM